MAQDEERAAARRAARNRENARSSTGPRTEAGKRRAARNAARHGVTGALDLSRVSAWYRTILDDPAARPDPLTRDPRRRAALALAEAEAHLERVRQAELTTMAQIAAEPEEMPRRVKIKAEDFTREAWPEAARDLLERARTAPPAGSKARRLKLMARYRAEAEARRMKALRRWIEALGEPAVRQGRQAAHGRAG